MSAANSFRELKVYQRARTSVGRVFRVSASFPREERYALTDQIRRSSRATKAMIAEAWGRRRYVAVFVAKLHEALGEATETQSWLDDALDAQYITEERFLELNEDWLAIAAMLSRMIDRAEDFCKNAPNTDYRFREEPDDQ